MQFTNKQTQEYFDDCMRNNDLSIFGIYDTKQDYGILHKWGKFADVKNLMNIMKDSIGREKAFDNDVFIMYSYPDFTLEEFDQIIHCSGFFGNWHKQKKGITNEQT